MDRTERFEQFLSGIYLHNQAERAAQSERDAQAARESAQETLYGAARDYTGKKKRRAAFLAGARWAESKNALANAVWAPEFVAYVQEHSPYKPEIPDDLGWGG